MAKYAYRDKDRKNIIYSDEAIEEIEGPAFLPLIICVTQNYIFAQLMGVKAPILETTKPILGIMCCPFE